MYLTQLNKMNYSISESRLVKLIKSLFGRKDVPKSLVDIIREKYINSYLSGLERVHNERFHGWGSATMWSDSDDERMISLIKKGREGNIININQKLITNLSGLLGITNQEVMDAIVVYLKPEIKGRIMSVEPFSFG